MVLWLQCFNNINITPAVDHNHILHLQHEFEPFTYTSFFNPFTPGAYTWLDTNGNIFFIFKSFLFHPPTCQQTGYMVLFKHILIINMTGQSIKHSMLIFGNILITQYHFWEIPQVVLKYCSIWWRLVKVVRPCVHSRCKWVNQNLNEW